MFYAWGGVCTEVQTLTFLFSIFNRQGYSFIYTFHEDDFALILPPLKTNRNLLTNIGQPENSALKFETLRWRRG